jgi:hypothetical protein
MKASVTHENNQEYDHEEHCDADEDAVLRRPGLLRTWFASR